MDWNHKSTSSRNKTSLSLGLFWVFYIKVIPFFSTLPFEFLPKRRTFICPFSVHAKIRKSFFFIIVFFSWTALLCVFCFFTMTFREKMRRSTMTCLTEAKVHLSYKINTQWRLTHLLDPSSMFHSRRKQSVAVVSSENAAALLSLFKMEQGKEKLCCGLMCQNSLSFWKSSILRPPGCRWLEPSGFSSVVSSQCLWCNQECI